MPTIAELNKLYDGQHILVYDRLHPDFMAECVFVEMVKKPYEKYPLMKVRVLENGKVLELKAKQIFFIVEKKIMPGKPGLN
jgi:hypothetical protein